MNHITLLFVELYIEAENLDLVNKRKLNIPFRFRKLANATFVLYEVRYVLIHSFVCSFVRSRCMIRVV